jgi:predicted O-methyltransferase YrrM
MKKFLLIFFILSLTLKTIPTFSTQENLRWEKYKKLVFINQKKIPGWCSKEKSLKMMDLIYNTKPNICVEIGVFGGSSVYPTAMALKFLKNGILYAIDPWTNEACIVGYQKNDPNYICWNEIDLEKTYKDFKSMLEKHNITPLCNVMRMTSEKAVNFFEDNSIDILHIDGNHSEEIALLDVKMFLSKVRKGGYIWFDDANWTSTAKAILYLKKYTRLNEEYSLKDNSCLLFQKY